MSPPRNSKQSSSNLLAPLPAPQEPPSGIGFKSSPFHEPEPGTAGRRPLWRRLLRLIGLGRATHVLHLSVFGPPVVIPGQTIKVTLNLHRPADADGVRTLARAFQHDAELLGTGALIEQIAQDEELAAHLCIANAGVGTSLQTFRWRGQPRRIVFEVYIPWEAPAGASVGVVSIGRMKLLIGKSQFSLNVLPRRG